MPWSRLKVCKKNQRAKFRKTFNQLISSRAKLSFERWAWGWKRRKHDPRKPLILTQVRYFFVLLAVRMKVGTQRAAAPLFVATVAAANGFYADTQFTAAHHHRRRHHHHHHQQQHCLHHRCNPCNFIFTQISNSQNCRSSKLIETIFLLGKRARQ